ncbi:MAG: hypothetical protein LBL90_02265 [Prevotellaceae bacterium]|jgi:hypothetical protein|nr:hypothetical protein [Prevotellaceae bacterium]
MKNVGILFCSFLFLTSVYVHEYKIQLPDSLTQQLAPYTTVFFSELKNGLYIDNTGIGYINLKIDTIIVTHRAYHKVIEINRKKEIFPVLNACVSVKIAE